MLPHISSVTPSQYLYEEFPKELIVIDNSIVTPVIITDAGHYHRCRSLSSMPVIITDAG